MARKKERRPRTPSTEIAEMVLKRLKSGPAAATEIAGKNDLNFASVAKVCKDLITAGKIIHVGHRNGARLYAMPHRNGAAPEAPQVGVSFVLRLTPEEYAAAVYSASESGAQAALVALKKVTVEGGAA